MSLYETDKDTVQLITTNGWAWKALSPYRSGTSGDFFKGIITDINAKGFEHFDKNYEAGTAKVFYSNGRMVQKLEDTAVIEKEAKTFGTALKGYVKKAKAG